MCVKEVRRCKITERDIQLELPEQRNVMHPGSDEDQAINFDNAVRLQRKQSKCIRLNIYTGYPARWV